MTTAVASPPVTAPSPADHQGSARPPYHPIAPSTSAPSPSHGVSNKSSSSSKHVENNGSPTAGANGAAHHARSDGGRLSPLSSRMSKQSQPSPPRPSASSRDEPAPPVKIEPSSPTLNPPAPRRRPQHLNLTASNHGNHVTHSSGALTSRPPIRDNGQDLALACLSPGLALNTPTMRDQLQRSAEVRDRQRQMIEARNKSGRDNPGPHAEPNSFVRSMNAPTNSRKKRPPPNLSIAPPSHHQFANERVIQSAPINQSFTGLRNGAPPSRHIPPHGPSGLGQGLQPYPPTQTNRLPPLADILSERQPLYRSPGHSSHSNQQPPLPSPGFPPQQQQQQHPTHEPRQAYQVPRERIPSPQDAAYGRPANAPQPATRREYGSADEPARAVRGEESRPAYYGGHQPPTPPSPQQMPSTAHPHSQAQAEAHFRGAYPRRRGRDEYERDNGSPPLGRQPARQAPFDEREPHFGDSPEERRRQFLYHVGRAYDLFYQQR